eukprot:gene2477-2781_t
MNEVKLAAVGLGAPSSTQLKSRLSRALFELNLKLASCKSGALVQVWMPEVCADGSVVLSAQGLPFAIAGIGDLLALFRCVSCRYRFSTDITRPSLMGAIGRVYSSCEPEMSHNVQKYDKQVYLRVSEAQRCRVHSTLVMPVFDAADETGGGRPVAVFELVQADRDVAFPAVIAELRKCLTDVSMSTSDPDCITTSVGLRKWSTANETSNLLQELGDELGGCVTRRQSSMSNSAGRLLLENDAPDDDAPTGPIGMAGAAAAAAGPVAASGLAVGAKPASSFISAWARPAESPQGGGAEEAEEDEDLLGSDDEEDGPSRMHGSCSAMHRLGGSSSTAAQRAMGAGRRLTFEDLQTQFGLGLKEAAANLGICATTLKRACRRNGITRWPRRQIQKLNKTLNQMPPQHGGPSIDELAPTDGFFDLLSDDMLLDEAGLDLGLASFEGAAAAAAAVAAAAGTSKVGVVSNAAAVRGSSPDYDPEREFKGFF